MNSTTQKRGFFSRLQSAVTGFMHGNVVVNQTTNNVTVKQIEPTGSTSIRNSQPSLEGFVYIHQIQECVSLFLIRAILFRAFGSVAAQAFATFRKVQSKRALPTDVKTYQQQLANCVAVIVASDDAGQPLAIDDDNLAWLANSGTPARFTEAKAKMIAEIRDEDVAEVMARNIAKREAVIKSNLDLVHTFIQELEGAVVAQMEGEPRINMKHVVNAGAHTMEWLAGWSDEISGSKEMLLVKSDVRLLEKKAAINLSNLEGAGESSREIDDELADASMMRQAAGAGK